MKRGQGKVGLERDLERFLEYLRSKIRGFPFTPANQLCVLFPTPSRR